MYTEGLFRELVRRGGRGSWARWVHARGAAASFFVCHHAGEGGVRQGGLHPFAQGRF